MQATYLSVKCGGSVDNQARALCAVTAVVSVYVMRLHTEFFSPHANFMGQPSDSETDKL